MPYKIEYADAASKAIRKLPTDIQRRIIARIESLADNPRPSSAIKLSGHDAYRTRVGDYRIIYAIADERLVVVIVEVGNRKDIYRGY